ncbi:hypothetical protein [Haliangium ochraceum]|uniref:Uncharacterized protein n=1 Tax=Haliangium ochraceum (strain DSM 14365 / JCM 11303 / SMP-2) TaxID=502025 RepID=D0LV60_HALO1|nr:hypothetical protein [Haliangium ochraceum]ACY15901.1 hypothetical protein Hoch_3399 [Haliangium ochraceum DSM 14365]
MLNRLFLVLVFVAMPLTAWAHPGPHSHPHTENAAHPMLSFEYALPVLGLLAAALLTWRWYRARD